MADPTGAHARRQVERRRRQFAQHDGLPFADVLPADRIDRAVREEGAVWRGKVFTPVLTVWAFLAQVLDPVQCCRAAVARIPAWLDAHGLPRCGAGAGGYCKARGRLPESLLARLARETGRGLHDGAPDRWRWRGRRVVVADGTGLSMPDTPAGRAAYPVPGSQKLGGGFPQARLVAVFGLATGAVVDAAVGPSRGKQTGENALLRSIAGSVERGSVLLADRYFAGWFDLASWADRGVDVVTRVHQKRATDFRRGRRLGREGQVVRWPKRQRPDWVDRATYLRLPEALEAREVRVRVGQGGFRTRVLVVVTTRTGPSVTGAELADLYRRRWAAERDLRSVTITLGMDVLRCQSPGMVRKGIRAHLLGYNLVRTVLAQAAVVGRREPRSRSVAAAVQGLTAFAGALAGGVGYGALMRFVLAYRVGDRPDRVEPRMRKRRPKPYPPRPVPRAQARKRLLGSR